MDKIINVKEIVARLKEGLKKRVENIKLEAEITPKLAVILANDSAASKLYVKKKSQLCDELGIEQETYEIGNDVEEEEVLNLIEKLNQDDSVDGILVQMPLYKHLNVEEVLLAIDPSKDVDALHPYNIGRCVAGYKVVKPCTAKGVITILDELKEPIEGKNVVIVGRSILVGKPLSYMFLERNATVTVCHSKTVDIGDMTRKADILVVATGVPSLIKEDMVKQGAIVIDVGINKLANGKIVGDVDIDNVLKRVRLITPVPGGVGLTTVLSLMQNLVELTEENYGVKYIPFEQVEEKKTVKQKVKDIPKNLKKYVVGKKKNI
ncbi:MAG: tetrahydrofolate dehydrogenase/cyclohydrolase catalytic domain-containing protein [Clostridia bacterium]